MDVGSILLTDDDAELASRVDTIARALGLTVVATPEAGTRVAVIRVRVPDDVGWATSVHLHAVAPGVPQIVVTDDLAGVEGLPVPGAELCARAAVATELDPRVRRALRRAGAGAPERLLAAAARFPLAIGPAHDQGDVLRATRTALLALPGLRGARVLVEPEGRAGRFEQVIEAGVVEEVAPARIAAAALSAPVLAGDGPWLLPMEGGVRGVFVVDVEPWVVPWLGVLADLAGVFGAAYGAARVFGTLKERAARLERGTLERQRQLARLSARMDRLSDARDSFLALLNHDLRSPIAVTLGQCQILDAGDVPPEAVPRAIDTIRRQAGGMSRLLDELLERYRRDSGARTDLAVGDLARIVRDLVDSFQPQAARRGQALRLDRVDEAFVEADLGLLRDVAANLLENALLVTPDLGTVRVSVGVAGDEVRLEVWDGGPGYGTPTSLDVDEGGRGVGFRVSARTVKAHGGRLRIVSHPEGGGVASVIFPRRFGAFGRDRVFVLGTDLDRLEHLAESLGVHWDVETSADPVAALDALGRAAPAAVVMDAVTGNTEEAIAILESMKTDPVVGAIPVVLLAPANAARLVDRAHGAGALAVLPAPVQAEALLANVRRALRMVASVRHTYAARAPDVLTGLETTAFLDARLPALVEEAQTNGVPLPVLLVDVFDLKGVNRTHGWRVGDQVLVWVAAALRDRTSLGDLVGRAQGDGFVVIFQGRSMETIEALAGELRAAVEAGRPRLGVAHVSVRIATDVVDATELGGGSSVTGLFELAHGGRVTPDGT